jgi:acyl-CoA synthetase (AMP-forming)/AMP-acid ligase II
VGSHRNAGAFGEQRYLAMTGRLKEIIIRGGMNIAPRELEDPISRMPDVQEVAVTGIPDVRLGELTCACVVADTPFEISTSSGFSSTPSLRSASPGATRLRRRAAAERNGQLERAELTRLTSR